MHSPTKTDPVTEHFGEVISTHSRGQAIEDGVLVDAGDMARQAGLLPRCHHPGGLVRLCGLDRCG